MPIELTLSELLTYSTVRIECTDDAGTLSVGTAFFFLFARQGNRSIPALITNRHVVAGAVSGRFSLHYADASGAPKLGADAPLELSGFEHFWLGHPDPAVDLCIMLVGPLLNAARSKGEEPFYTQLDATLVPSEQELQQLTALEDIVMVGYPIGIWDSHNNMPIVRKGITATAVATDYNGRKEFMIDAACFPGSSGSPVFLFSFGTYATRENRVMVGSRFKLLGVLYAGPQYSAEGEMEIVTIPTQQRAISRTMIPTNLGICIKSSRILEFEQVIQRLIGSTGPNVPEASGPDSEASAQ